MWYEGIYKSKRKVCIVGNVYIFFFRIEEGKGMRKKKEYLLNI